jgi:hypothetical protein
LQEDAVASTQAVCEPLTTLHVLYSAKGLLRFAGIQYVGYYVVDSVQA